MPDESRLGVRSAVTAIKAADLLAAILLAAMFAFYLTTTLHHDVSWYLVATDRMLDGDRLYVDIIEINPPLAFYLTVPPIAFARLTDLAPAACFIGYAFLLIGVSLLLIRRLLERQADLSAGYRAAMLLAAAAALAVAPVGVFGQREHLMLIFALPYLFLASARFAGRELSPRLAALVGLLAAIGFCLKPHFLLAPAAIEFCLMVQRRSLLASFRPECWSLLASGLAYAAFAAIIHPEYFSFIIPNAMLVYDAYSTPLASVILRIPVFAALPMVTLWVVLRMAGVVNQRTDAFGIAALAFLAAYVAQSKGWMYQLLPALTTACVAAAAIAAELLTKPPAARGRLLPLIAAAALGAPVVMLLGGGAYRNPLAQRLLPAVERYADNGTIYAFTSYVSVGFPLVNDTHARWASRFPTQWMLPGALRHLAHPEGLDAETRERLLALERYARDAVITDLERAPPDLVIVDKSGGYYGDMKFDALAYFGADSRFAAFWQPYVKAQEVDFTVAGFKFGYELWCRRNAARNCAG